MSDLKECYYGFAKEALSPYEAFSESVGLKDKTNIEALTSPIEVGGMKYYYQFTIDVNVGELGLDRAKTIYDGLELVSKGANFRYIEGTSLTSYYQSVREDETSDEWFAEEERLFA